MHNESVNPELSQYTNPQFKADKIMSLDLKVAEVLKNRITDLATIYKNLNYLNITENQKHNFSEKKLAKDLRYVERKQELIEHMPLSQSDRETLQMSKGLECMIIDQLPNMINKESHILTTINYDDYSNGCDLVLKTQDGEILSIDTTLGKDSNYKLTETAEKYNKNELYKLDYFLDEKNNLQNIQELPHIVLGIDRKHFEEALPGWLNNEGVNQYVKSTILSEAVTQLEIYQRYFEQKSQPQRAEKFAYFAKLFKESLNQIDQISTNDYDDVQEMIENSLLENYHSSVTAPPKNTDQKPKTGKIIKVKRPFK